MPAAVHPRAVRSLAAAATAVALGLAAVPPAHAAPQVVLASGPLVAPAAKKPVRSVAVAPAEPRIRTCPLRFGAGTAGGPAASAELAEVAALAGEAPSVVLSYKDFNQPVPYGELEQTRAAGATTLLTWEPWAWGGGVDQPAYSLDAIASGAHDDYIRSWAEQLAAWDNPVMLRFAHEMNGNWYPWAEGVNGNEAGDYVAAYRHVHDIFTAAGAENVEWVWNPNTTYWGSTPMAGLYPGDAYVDTVGLDGYNWGTSQAWSTWQQPWELFGWGLDEARSVAPGKKIIIGEVASAEAGGSKAEWNAHLVYYLASQPDVTGMVWFNENKETDWRINSSTASAQSLAAELAKRPCP